MLSNCEMRTGFHGAFIRHVGVGRRFSVAVIAEMLGVSKSFVQKWLSGEKVPCARNLMKLFRILGAPFTNAVLGTVGQGGAQPISDEPACVLKAMAAGADATAYAAEALSDGAIDENKRRIGSDMFLKAANLWRRSRFGGGK